jgi:hypothetical protein
MAQHALPHYDHHLRELHRTRKRFRLGLAMIVATLTMGAGLYIQDSFAETYVSVGGRVFNSTTGAGIPNVTIYVCQEEGDKHRTVTNSSGNWSLSVPYQAPFCVRYESGAPSYLTGPAALNNQPGFTGAVSYESQVAGFNCYTNTSSSVCGTEEQKRDRTVDSGYNFRFTGVAPAKTPSPTPKTKPNLSLAAVLAKPVSAAEGDKTPPSTPLNLQATVAEGNATVQLMWEPSSDANGIKAYILERSLDQSTWERLADDITSTSYTDDSAAYGIHYYYHLRASDLAGNLSAVAAADVTTPDFSANSSEEDATTYTSEDEFASVSVPGGAVAGTADCSVAVTSYDDTRKLGPDGQLLVVGPYYLLCKTISGKVITEFLKPLEWTFDVKDKLKGMNNPKAFTFKATAPGELIKGSVHDTKSSTVRVSTTSPDPVMVMADPNTGISLNFVAAFILLGGILVGVAVLIVRTKQKSTYDAYLRKKYYNL